MKSLKCPKRVSKRPCLPPEKFNFTSIRGINYDFLKKEYHKQLDKAFKVAEEKGLYPSIAIHRPTKRVQDGFFSWKYEAGDELFLNISFKPW